MGGCATKQESRPGPVLCIFKFSFEGFVAIALSRSLILSWIDSLTVFLICTIPLFAEVLAIGCWFNKEGWVWNGCMQDGVASSSFPEQDTLEGLISAYFNVYLQKRYPFVVNLVSKFEVSWIDVEDPKKPVQRLPRCIPNKENIIDVSVPCQCVTVTSTVGPLPASPSHNSPHKMISIWRSKARSHCYSASLEE